MSIKIGQLYSNPSVCFMRSDIHRFGVFAKKDIQEGDLICQSPYFAISNDEINEEFEDSVLLRYLHPVEDDMIDGEWIVGMGYASAFNHDPDANIQWELDPYNEVMNHYAIEDIKAGEELVLDYEYDSEEDEEEEDEDDDNNGFGNY